jgi:hypothetical protein
MFVTFVSLAYPLDTRFLKSWISRTPIQTVYIRARLGWELWKSLQDGPKAKIEIQVIRIQESGVRSIPWRGASAPSQ